MTSKPDSGKDVWQRLSAPFRRRARPDPPAGLPSSPLPTSITGSSARSGSTASVTAPSPPQTTPPSVQLNPILQATLHRLKELSTRDRAVIENYVSTTPQDIHAALDRALAEALLHKQRYLDQRWTFTFNGRSYTAADKVDKIVKWLYRFKAAGDVAVNADPVHAGLPWAGIRLLLEAATSDVNQMGLLLTGCETALYMCNRLRVYTDIFAQLPPKRARDNFQASLAELYACILRFLAHAIRLCEVSTTRRIVQNLWKEGDIGDFQTKCDQLATRAEIEARICDRLLFEQQLQTVLAEIKMIHGLEHTLDRVEAKIDHVDMNLNIDRLPCAKGVEFDAYGSSYRTCLSNTRTEILHKIQSWACQKDGQRILWLSGRAGTGKSTIAYTISKWLTELGNSKALALGASFFFKRGASDRSSAALFFPTIIRQIIRKVEGLDVEVTKALDSNPSIGQKLLGEQFDRLIYEPLQRLPANASLVPLTLVVVVDALDECADAADIRAIIDLWSKTAQITSVDLKLFLSSRPDLPIKQGFWDLALNLHLDMDLQAAVPFDVIRHDIHTFLKHEFSNIRREDTKLGSSPALSQDWPGEHILEELTDIAVPLFIVAATICRFVGDTNWDPHEQLEKVRNVQGLGGRMAQTYYPVLIQYSASVDDAQARDVLHQDFRTIVGAIITLSEPLSISSLAILLNRPARSVSRRLQRLHSVLQIPSDNQEPIQTLHLSFSEFLLSDQLNGQPFQIDGAQTHAMLAELCLDLLSNNNEYKLREDICRLKSPGQLRQHIETNVIETYLPAPVQYAVLHWVYHAQESKIRIQDNDQTHTFLQNHFLHWFEALSILGRSATAIRHLRQLQSFTMSTNATSIATFLEDAHRFALHNRHVSDLAPLQLYSSAILFSPEHSVVRTVCGHIPDWVRQPLSISKTWGPELAKLEGHTGFVRSVAFSPDGKLLASASDDRTVRLWDASTGQQVQQLQGHSDSVDSVIFSPDSKLLVSTSPDSTTRVWNVSTGQEIQRFPRQYWLAAAVAFSPDGSLLAAESAPHDSSICLWDTSTRQEFQQLGGASRCRVTHVSFSPNGKLLASVIKSWDESTDRTIRLWDIVTGQELHQCRAQLSCPSMSSLSHNGKLLVIRFKHGMICMWNINKELALYQVRALSSGRNAISSPDGKLIASVSVASGLRTAVSAAVHLWNVSTGQGRELQCSSKNRVFTPPMAFSPNSKLLCCSFHDTIWLWDTGTKPYPYRLYGHVDRVSAVVFSPDGNLIASASYDKTIRLWSVSTRQEVQRSPEHTSIVTDVVFSPDGKLLASTSDYHTIRLWDVSRRQELQQLEGHDGESIFRMVFSPNSKLLAWVSGSSSGGGTIHLWDINLQREIQQSRENFYASHIIVFSPDSKLLVWTWKTPWDTENIHLWNTSTGTEVLERHVHTSMVSCMAFSLDGRRLASAAKDGTIRLWDTNTGCEVQQFMAAPTLNLCFSDDCTYILTDSETFQLDPGIISCSDGALINSSQQHRHKARVTVDGEWIQYDGHDILWLPHEHRVAVRAVYDNTIAFGQEMGQVGFLTLDPSKLPPLGK